MNIKERLINYISDLSDNELYELIDSLPEDNAFSFSKVFPCEKCVELFGSKSNCEPKDCKKRFISSLK